MLWKMAHGGCVERVQFLLAADRVDIATGHNDSTLLMAAVDEGHTEIIKLMTMTNRVDVNKQDAQGFTTLHRAVRLGRKSMVDLLSKELGVFQGGSLSLSLPPQSSDWHGGLVGDRLHIFQEVRRHILS